MSTIRISGSEQPGGNPSPKSRPKKTKHFFPTAEDLQFIANFESLALTLDKFHHCDHVRLAFLYLQRYAALDAVARFSTNLKRFAEFHGKSDLYHETITCAFIFLIRERMARQSHQPEQSWADFASKNSDLINEGKNLLRKYYREETLLSDLARTTFLFPDRI